MGRLTLALLGPLEVTLDGQQVAGFAYDKVRALLVYLAVEAERPQRREALAALLWPEQPDVAARNNLRRALLTLRAAIGDQDADPPFLLIARDSIQFNRASDYALDVASFTALIAAYEVHGHTPAELCRECVTRLEHAIALYRGDFLAQFALRDSVAFSEWALVMRERLHRQALGALAGLLAYHEQQGAHETAQDYARRLLALEPWDEAAHRCLLRVFARQGRRNAALAQYARCRQVLAEELGIEPSPETSALYEQIRGGRCARAVGTPAVERAARAADPRPVAPPAGLDDAPPGDPTVITAIHTNTVAIQRLTPSPQPAHALLNGHAPAASVPAELFEPSLRRHHADPPRSATPPPWVTNLPAPPTPLIGREQDVVAICDRLRDDAVRLLTLVGPPGVGKTRLALAVAATLQDDFDDGVYVVALAPLRDPALVGAAIAQTLGVQEAGDRPLVELLKSYLREKALLLVLDNCEHMLEAAPCIADLLAACPQIKVLTTSRAALHVRAERQFPIAPLALPDLTDSDDLQTIAQSPAVALFVERAQAVEPDFTLRSDNTATVAAICVRLEGLPLAIELAAVRSRTLPPQALLAQLDHRLAVLTNGPRDLPTHLQTLRGAIAWSYDLLDPDSQALFRRLGVFVGGCTMEAAQAICVDQLAQPSVGDSGLSASAAIAHGLTVLCGQHLVQRETGPNDESRFTMLETIREYARERLEDSVEAESLRRRHAIYYLSLAEAALPELHGPNVRVWLARLEQEHDNLRAALHCCAEAGDRAVFGLELAGALWTFWQFNNTFAEGRTWLETFVRQSYGTDTTTRTLRARALLGAGWLAYYQDDYVSGAAYGTESLALYQQADEAGGRAYALNLLGFCDAALGDYPSGIARLEESVALSRAAGDPYTLGLALINLGFLHNDQGDIARAQPLFEEGLAWGRKARHPVIIARALNALGELARMQGSYQQAGVYYDESFALYRDMQNRRGMATLHHNLGCVAQYHGDCAPAWNHFAHSLAYYRELGDKAGTAAALAGLAGVVGMQAQPERAARLFGAARALRDASGAAIIPPDLYDYERNVAAVRAQLDEATFAAAWEAGRALTLDQAIAEAFLVPVADTAS